MNIRCNRSQRALHVGFVLVLAGCLASSIDAQKGGGASSAQPQAGGAGAQGGATPYFETVMEAYGAVNQLSETIAREVCRSKNLPSGATIVIFDPSSFQNVVAWQSFSAAATALKGAYETLLTQSEVDGLFPPPPRGAIKMLSGIPITGASDLAGLITALASSTTNNASTFTIQDSTMAVSLAHQFTRVSNCDEKHKYDLKYYPLFGSYVDLTSSDKFVQDALDDLNKLRQYIQHAASLGTTTTGATTSVLYVLLADLNSQYDLLIKSISSGVSQEVARNSVES